MGGATAPIAPPTVRPTAYLDSEDIHYDFVSAVSTSGRRQSGVQKKSCQVVVAKSFPWPKFKLDMNPTTKKIYGLRCPLEEDEGVRGMPLSQLEALTQRKIFHFDNFLFWDLDP